MLTKACAVRVKAAGTDDDLPEGVFTALVSVFGNKDSYGDIVRPGAFKNTLAEWAESGDPIPVYWSHRMDDPDYNIGHVLEASETDEGLLVKAQIDLDSPKAQQVYRLLKGRRVTQFSFAYDIVAGGPVTEDGDEFYSLDELKLYEVGPTPIGANQATELLAVKDATHVAERLAAAMRADGVKAGRVLSAKNEGAIRRAHEALGEVLAALDSTDDQEKANRTDGRRADAAPEGTASTDRHEVPSVDDLAATMSLLALSAPTLEGEGGSL